MKQDKFLHPYGSLGDYRLPEHQDGLYFGNENYNDLNSIAKNIKTYSERSEPISEVTVAIRKELAEAETIIFLGFAFHLQNIELIRPPEGIKAKRIFATTKGRYV